MLISKRVCIFVDGENLRHSIGELFSSFDNRDYLPKKANWEKFFDWVASEAVGQDADRIRTYWYVVENIDFSPFNLNSARKDKILLKKILSRDNDIARHMTEIGGETKVNEFMEKEVDKLLEVEHMMKDRFTGWINIQDTIERYNRSVEFRRAGSIRYDLFKRDLGFEKAVDVKLAADLIQLKDIYDVAVIVSGDQDHVPAVDAIKDSGKRTVNVAFLTENDRLLPGGAKRLNQSTDWSIEVKYSDLKTYLGF